jgi:hypothetical protein
VSFQNDSVPFENVKMSFENVGYHYGIFLRFKKLSPNLGKPSGLYWPVDFSGFPLQTLALQPNLKFANNSRLS